MILPFIGAKQVYTHKLKLPPCGLVLAASFLRSIYFIYPSAEGLNGTGDAEIGSL